MTMLTIDPGYRAAGWALWDRVGFKDMIHSLGRQRKKPAKLLRSGVVAVTGQPTPALGARLLCLQIDNEVRHEGVGRVYVEQPVMFGGDVGLAIAKRNDLTKLAFAAGVFVGHFKGASPFGVPVNEWIRQLPKDVMHRRVKKRLLEFYTEDEADALLGEESHNWDAVGIGLYIQGFWHKD